VGVTIPRIDYDIFFRLVDMADDSVLDGRGFTIAVDHFLSRG
jgi:hypothetical protein